MYEFIEATSSTNDGSTRSDFHNQSYHEKCTNDTYIIKLVLLMHH
jgi:hypothetical protein